MKAKRKRPSIVLEGGKPAAVILDIEAYRLLERLEDLEDLKALEEMRKKPLQLRDFDDFMKEYAPDI